MTTFHLTDNIFSEEENKYHVSVIMIINNMVTSVFFCEEENDDGHGNVKQRIEDNIAVMMMIGTHAAIDRFLALTNCAIAGLLWLES